jgi:hypothetical protein
MSQREYDALMRAQVAAQKLFVGLTVDQLEAFARDIHLVEAAAQGRIDQRMFVPVRPAGPDGEDAPEGIVVRLQRHPLEIDSAVPYMDRLAPNTRCESARTLLKMRVFIPSSAPVIRVFGFEGSRYGIEEAEFAIRANGCRPATIHELVAFLARYGYEYMRAGLGKNVAVTGDHESLAEEGSLLTYATIDRSKEDWAYSMHQVAVEPGERFFSGTDVVLGIEEDR